MLDQYLFRDKETGATGFVDSHSSLCIDGKPCDTNGDTLYVIDGQRFRERDFKEYRKFSPQFRHRLIMENARKAEQSVTLVSCTCSKCGTVAADEAYWTL